MTSVLRVIGNSLAFLLSIILAIWFFKTNPLISFFFIISAFDNYEDVYEVVTRKRLIPYYLIPIDIIIEVVMLLFGMYVLMLGYMYYVYFETPFAIFLLVSGISIVISSTKDIAKDIMRLRGVSYGVGIHKIEKFEFLRRKY
jgi:hypothetical protein